MMYHSVQSQRYGRAKGLKVKHLVQLVVLTVLFTWFLYQLNSSHQAKVLLQRAEKANDIDDELLISDDKGVIDRNGIDLDEIAAGEIGHDEFIDKTSVLKSRKILPELMDTGEQEQGIVEGDRAELRTEDALDDSGEGDRDERGAYSDEDARWTEETRIETQERDKRSVLGEENLKSIPYKRAADTANDRGDSEDEIQAEVRAGKEFDGGDGWAANRNVNEVADDATLIYTNREQSKVKEIDANEVWTPADFIEVNAEHIEIPHEEAERTESITSDGSALAFKTPEERNPINPDEDAMHDVEVGDETKSGVIATQDSSEDTEVNETPQTDVTSRKVGLVRNDRSKKVKDTGEMNPRSPSELSEGATENPGDGKIEQGRRTGILRDGLEESVSETKQDKPAQQEAILEVVSTGKQGQSDQQNAIAEVAAN